MKRAKALAAVVVALATLTTAASATIIGTSGQMVKIAPPPSVAIDALESDTTLYAFDEQQNVTLAEPLEVDITTPGTYDDESDLTPGTIPAGTVVSSQFVNGDHIGTQFPAVFLDGTITTDSDIVGIVILQRQLNRSDFLGAPGTIYPTGDFGRGLNLDNQDDFVIEQIDRRTVQIHSQVRIHADQVRIITRTRSPVGGEGTMGFWQNKNGQALIKGGTSTGGVCNSGTYLRTYNPFMDLSATATCAQVATYVTNVVKAASASGTAMNAMLKAQMLATALDVFFGRVGGNVNVDLTYINKPIGSGSYENTSGAFGGGTCMTVNQLLAYASSQSNSGGSAWYGQVKATQELAKDTFDAINNGVAFTC